VDRPTLLSSNLNVQGYRELVEQKDAEKLIRFIRERFTERYIEPMRVELNKKNGFTIMAISCLMIESLESFYQGWSDSKGSSKQVFCNIFDKTTLTINAKLFHDQVAISLDNYCKELQIESWNSDFWNNFKKKMGSNKDTIVIVGDNGMKDVIVKGLESTISKSIIDIFIKNKYETYIIDEFRTSKLCNGCENPLSKWLYVKSNKPNSEGKMYKSNGILRCQSSTHLCNVIHNRDKNAVKNMLKLVENYKLTGKRLLKYSCKFSL